MLAIRRIECRRHCNGGGFGDTYTWGDKHTLSVTMAVKLSSTYAGIGGSWKWNRMRAGNAAENQGLFGTGDNPNAALSL